MIEGTSIRDNLWLGGAYLEYDLPPEKMFLKKYFKTEQHYAFLKYFLVMGEFKNFIDHTGFFMDDKMPYKLAKKYRLLIEKYDEYKSKMMFKELTELNAGEFKIPKSLR